MPKRENSGVDEKIQAAATIATTACCSPQNGTKHELPLKLRKRNFGRNGL
jgi:hypothetical protein